MKLGVVFPQTEIGSDPVAIRDYAQTVEALGYDHILIYDHVLGADPTQRPDWGRRYTSADMFHEVFVLYGYLAALTQRVELVTGVLVLPQRQTALVAKQAAEVDRLSGGRLRLGVGVGWNAVEYQGLNENFGNRGVRMEEQIALLRALWTQPIVTFKGHWHQIEEAGLNPLPVQRPIPIWMGGDAKAALQRAARLGDGWFPLGKPDERARGMLEQVYRYLHEAGRTPQEFGIHAHLGIRDETEKSWAATAEEWRKLGATHLCVNSMNAGLHSPQEHIDSLRRVKEVLTDF